MSEPTFTYLSNERIAALVHGAKTRVIYAAPNLSERVADELLLYSVLTVIEDDVSLRVVVDADSECYRNGFGEFAGLKTLTDAKIEVRNAPGLRIGVLVIDEKAWVFSPTPEIIFDQPDDTTLNAVEVSESFAQQILVSIAPDLSINDEDPLENVVIPDSVVPEIGVETVTQKEIIKIEAELAEAPPQKFDATRQIRVYQSYFQFVEIHLEKCNLNSHRIPVPPDLLEMVSDVEVRERLNTSYRLVDRNSPIVRDFNGIIYAVNDLREEFTKSIGKHHGRVLKRSEKAKFEERVAAIKSTIEKAKGELLEALTTEIEKNCYRLAAVLSPDIIRNPPRSMRYALLNDEPDKDSVCEMLVRRLRPSDNKIADLVSGMKLEVIFKDITYDMLNDEDFVAKVHELFPDIESLHHENDALSERKK
ncbi:MAG TPA: hypothetical protein PKA82_12925 [Pyrinomonadaceae bacterium]|nr:hypothetical protein [Pyrinomonadaceae bacterium]